jgi:hypothetical protein
MVARKKQNPPGSPDVLNLNLREKRAAVHGSQIPPIAAPTQVARRCLARPKAPRWFITKRLAALRCAALTVMAFKVRAKVVDKAYIFHHPDDHWTSRVHAYYVYYSQYAKAFVAPLVAEILFAEKPPPEARSADYSKFGRSIERSGVQPQEEFAETCLQEVFDALMRNRVAVVQITYALLERESLSGDEIKTLMKESATCRRNTNLKSHRDGCKSR